VFSHAAKAIRLNPRSEDLITLRFFSIVLHSFCRFAVDLATFLLVSDEQLRGVFAARSTELTSRSATKVGRVRPTRSVRPHFHHHSGAPSARKIFAKCGLIGRLSVSPVGSRCTNQRLYVYSSSLDFASSFTASNLVSEFTKQI
jgi:hypothetical protein